MMLENTSEELSVEDNSVDYTLMFLLAISVALVALDGVELIKLSHNFTVLKTVPTFEACIKWEIFSKVIFGLFSFLAALSALILTSGLLIDSNMFISKVMDTFLYFNYIVFGPYLLTCSILAIINLDHTMVRCDNDNPDHHYFSLTNISSIIVCTCISLVITVAKSIYDAILLFNNSMLRRENGSYIILKLFWWIITRNRLADNPNIV
jgi:hypothetical protein